MYPLRRAHHSFQKYYPSSDDKKSSDNPKLRDILQINWLVLFKRVKVKKDKERLRNCYGLRGLRRHDKCEVGPWIGSWQNLNLLFKANIIASTLISWI
jgi:hypothetical protein